jgi:hypothetical protein
VNHIRDVEIRALHLVIVLKKNDVAAECDAAKIPAKIAANPAHREWKFSNMVAVIEKFVHEHVSDDAALALLLDVSGYRSKITARGSAENKTWHLARRGLDGAKAAAFGSGRLQHRTEIAALGLIDGVAHSVFCGRKSPGVKLGLNPLRGVRCEFHFQAIISFVGLLIPQVCAAVSKSAAKSYYATH